MKNTIRRKSRERSEEMLFLGYTKLLFIAETFQYNSKAAVSQTNKARSILCKYKLTWKQFDVNEQLKL